MSGIETFTWEEKYRPQTVKDTILPQDIKNVFLGFVKKEERPNLILAGPPGCGKTTVAAAMLKELGCDYLLINSSLEGGKATLRNEITEFATNLSFKGKRKYVIMDEADDLTRQTQLALRGFMQDYHDNCGFIFTCNMKHKLIEPLISRCVSVDFTFSKEQRNEVIKEMLLRLFEILDTENVTYKKEIVAQLLKNYFPDFRRTLNFLQGYAMMNDTIDSGALVAFDEKNIVGLFAALKDKDLDKILDWVAEFEMNETDVYTLIYEIGSKHIDKASIPSVIAILAKYQYQAAFAVDQNINLAAALVEIAAEAEFK